MIHIMQFEGVDPETHEPVYGVVIAIDEHTEVIDGIEKLVEATNHVLKFKTEIEADIFIEKCRTASPS